MQQLLSRNPPRLSFEGFRLLLAPSEEPVPSRLTFTLAVSLPACDNRAGQSAMVWGEVVL